jgi:hypothetical protein
MEQGLEPSSDGAHVPLERALRVRVGTQAASCGQRTTRPIEMPPNSPRNACALLGRLVFAKMMFSKKASATPVPSRPPSACILPGHWCVLRGIRPLGAARSHFRHGDKRRRESAEWPVSRAVLRPFWSVSRSYHVPITFLRSVSFCSSAPLITTVRYTSKTGATSFSITLRIA